MTPNPYSKTLFKLALLYVLFVVPFYSTAQKIHFEGKVIDALSGDALAGASIILDQVHACTSNENGLFTLTTEPGNHQLIIYHVGYRDTLLNVPMTSDHPFITIHLIKKEEMLQEVIIGANRYGRALIEQISSISTINPKEVQFKNIQDAAQAIDQLSGVVVIDGQASIRGGSGYAFGAGSRVMMVYDGVPMLTSDRNDVKWSFIPMENVERIELVKGASSVQYGSSALNGVLNIQTAFAVKDDETTFSTYLTRYDGSIPDNKIRPEDKVPFATGGYLLHKMKRGKSDFVINAYAHRSQSWLQGEFAKRSRLHVKYRYRLSERTSFGINLTGMLQHTSQFFFWSDDSVGAYQPLNGTTSLVNLKELYTVAQANMHHFDRNNIKHTAHIQYYHTNHINGRLWQPATNLFSADYHMQKEFNTWILSGGVYTNAFFFRDDGIGGRNSGNQGSLFVQFEKAFNKFRIEGGGRMELFRLDTIYAGSRPVGRIGINYSPYKQLSLRASFGQGFRFPSPAERFVNYSLGDIYIYPNPTLLPEKGWSSEIGLRKKASLGKFNAYADWALFLQGFTNMMEFSFGQWGNTSAPFFGLGFKSVNVNEARIAGSELELGVQKNIGKLKLLTDIGYTYTYPVDLNADSSLRSASNFMQGFIKGLYNPDSIFRRGLLRYRNRHLIKFDLDVSYNRLSFGGSIKYYSRMDNIDSYLALFIPGVDGYRKDHLQGDWLFDLRLSYQADQYGKVALICNNLLNSFYAIRIARPDAPRGFTIQYTYTL